jgi:hypothetical protein
MRTVGEFRTGDFATHGTGRDFDPRIVADALALSQFTVRHEVQFVVVFGEPDGRVHGHATLAKRGEADVSLAMDFGGDGCHGDIVK